MSCLNAFNAPVHSGPSTIYLIFTVAPYSLSGLLSLIVTCLKICQNSSTSYEKCTRKDVSLI